MDAKVETECSALEGLFQQIIADMKASFPIWDDFMNKATKLHTALRTTLMASNAFLESFQKIADIALGTRGATSELGSALTKLCLRQKGIEEKIKSFSSAIMDLLVIPLQERMEDWKRTVVHLDKEHSKESKKCHQEIKKAHSESVRLKKKSKKGKPEVTKQLDHALAEFNLRYSSLECLQRNAVRTALIEQRSRFCLFISCLRPVMEFQVSALSDIAGVREILDCLHRHSTEPYALTSSTEHVVMETRRTTSSDMIPQTTVSSMTMTPTRGETTSGGGGSHGSRKSSLSSTSSGCPAGGGLSPSHQSHGNSSNAGMKTSTISDVDEAYEQLDFHCQSSLRSPGPARSSTASPSRMCSSPSGGTMMIPEAPIWSEQLNPEQTCETCYDLPPTNAQQVILNPYAVPSFVGSERVHVQGCMTVEGGPPQELVRQESREGNVLPVNVLEKMQCDGLVPLEGYVNMNQLACLAVQQHDLDRKKKDGPKISSTPVKLSASPSSSSQGSETPNVQTMRKSMPSADITRANGDRKTVTVDNALRTGGFEFVADMTLDVEQRDPFPIIYYNSLPRPGWSRIVQGHDDENPFPGCNLLISNPVQTPKGPPTAPRPSNLATPKEDRASPPVGCMGTIRRGNARDRSLPPLSRYSNLRKTSIPAASHGVTATGQGVTATGQGVTATGHGVTVTAMKGGAQYCAVHGMRRTSGPASVLASDTLPPPPPDLQDSICDSFPQHDDVDDLPLPPPPEELRGRSLTGTEKPTVTFGRSRSVASPAGHASILEHLTNKFYGDERVIVSGAGVELRQGQGRIGTVDHRTASQRNTTCDVAASRSIKDSGQDESSGKCQGGNSFSDVIQRGVALRRTITSDRSAPKLPKNL